MNEVGGCAVVEHHIAWHAVVNHMRYSWFKTVDIDCLSQTEATVDVSAQD